MNQQVTKEKNGLVTRQNVSKYGVGAVASAALVGGSNANAAIDVSGVIESITTDGTSAITAVGVALLTLAGIAVVLKWVKASIFS